MDSLAQPTPDAIPPAPDATPRPNRAARRAQAVATIVQAPDEPKVALMKKVVRHLGIRAQGYDSSAFTIEWAQRQVVCPKGKVSRSWDMVRIRVEIGHAPKTRTKTVILLRVERACLPFFL